MEAKHPYEILSSKCILVCMSTQILDRHPIDKLSTLGVFGLQFSQTCNCRADSHSRSRGKGVCTSSHYLTARATAPDSGIGTLDAHLSTKDTLIRRVLRNLNLSQQLTQSRTISGSILSGDSDLLCASSHFSLL